MFKTHGALHEPLKPKKFIQYFATLKCPHCDHTSECKVSLSKHIEHHETAVSEKHVYCKIRGCDCHNTLKWMYKHLAETHKVIMRTKNLVDDDGRAIRHSLRTCKKLCNCKQDKRLIQALNEKLYKDLLAYPQKNSGVSSTISSSTDGGGGSGAAAQTEDGA
jgi:hypothetical protein